MNVTRLSPDFSVSPQLRPEDLPLAKEAGYRAIVNNRPDDEEAGQPRSDALRRAAQQLGLRYSHIPVTAGQLSAGQVRALTRAIAEADGPVLAFCRSGARSTKLWELARRSG